MKRVASRFHSRFLCQRRRLPTPPGLGGPGERSRSPFAKTEVASALTKLTRPTACVLPSTLVHLRLVVDDSICNTNQNCTVPEQSACPACRTFKPLTRLEKTTNLCQASAWTSRAHTRHLECANRTEDLLDLRQQNRLFFNKVCTVSSHWFARLGSFFTRCLHLLMWPRMCCFCTWTTYFCIRTPRCSRKGFHEVWGFS